MTVTKAAAPVVADAGWRRAARLGLRSALAALPREAADFLYTQVKGTAKRIGVPPEPQEVTLLGGARLRLDMTDGMQRNMYYLGFLEPRYVACLARYVRPGGMFVDVGANVGYYAVWAALRVGPAGYVYAFEPNPVAFDHMAANVALNGLGNVTLHKVALGEQHGTGCLKLCLGQLGGSRLIAGETRDEDLVSVQIETLDSYLTDAPMGSQVDVMKIDAEGAEAAILRGAAQVLGGSMQPYLLMEVDDRLLRQLGSSATSILADLGDYGYRPFRVARDGSTLPLRHGYVPAHTNLLFVPDGRPVL